ncbi:MAG TPA: hypothetical protein VMO00_06250 [Methylomirabilota bacterium]|nr:hypothetical protein [Methylomirabilota bacterium]
MNKVYESLKEAVQETLRNKANSTPVARLKGNDASSLSDEMVELEKMVVDGIARLKAAIKKGEAVVAVEAEHAEEVIESLRAKIAGLEAELKAAEETVRKKELSKQKLEENLTGKIHDLQNEVKKKEEALESRANEINDLKSKGDVLGKQVNQLESALQQAKARAAGEAERTERATENSKAKIAALEAQLREAEKVVRGKESTIKVLEQNLATRIQDLEGQVRDKEKLLADRDIQVHDLNSQLEILKNGIKGMSSFFRQTDVLAAVAAQEVAPVLPEGRAKKEEQKPAASQVENPAVAFNSRVPTRETVSPDFFYSMTHELTQIMGPMASMIVRDHVAALGESIEKFPKTRVTELLEIVSEEILDEDVKIGFRERLGLWPFCGVPVAGTRD